MNKQDLVHNSVRKFKLMRVRMKINFMAFAKSMLVSELFLDSILRTYYQRSNQGLVSNPWPEENPAILEYILSGKLT